MRPSAHVLLESSHIAEEIPSPDCSRSLPPPWSSSSPTVTDDCCVTFTRLSPDIPIGCSVVFFPRSSSGLVPIRPRTIYLRAFITITESEVLLSAGSEKGAVKTGG